MAERIAIAQGLQPWLPSENAELVETLHHYDMPLIGVVRQGNALHLFRCIEGHVDSTQLWAYTRLTPEELDELRAAGPDDLDAVVERLVAGKPTVLALADDERGLTVSALLGDLSGYPSPLHAARAALGEARLCRTVSARPVEDPVEDRGNWTRTAEGPTPKSGAWPAVLLGGGGGI